MTLDQRLQLLEKRLEDERVQQNIPGFAVGVVKDGKLIFAKGFGVADVEQQTPVSTETVFPIGSSTKSFTSTLIGILVDEEKMKLSDPVTKYLPEVDFKVEGDGKVTIRDLLCHRTGFTRMGMLYSGTLPRDQVVLRAAKAKPVAGFKERFIYTNIMFTVAGVCAGKSSQTDWDSLIQKKIFKPLKMTDSSTKLADIQDRPGVAKGYTWNSDSEKFEPVQLMSLDSIGPAGSINSNVKDMSKWIQALLANGKVDDRQIVSKKQLLQTRKAHTSLAPGVDYGLGWMLQDWKKMKVIQHGGNVPGFSAQVALLPEKNTGFVLLSNVSFTPLQAKSINLVFDALYAEPERDMADVDTDELVGKYVANVAQFKDAIMEIKKMDGGKIGIDVPGQRLYELKAPDKEGKWYFALTDTIAVSFEKDAGGKVTSMTMYQHGSSTKFPRVGADENPPADLPPEITRHAGSYFDKANQFQVDIEFKAGKLLANMHGDKQTFYPPSKGKRWTTKPSRFGIEFNVDEKGIAQSIDFYQPGPKIVLKRIAKSQVPTVSEVIKKVIDGYGTIDQENAGIQLSGTLDFVHQGVNGSIAVTISRSGQHFTDRDLGDVCRLQTSFDGESGYSWIKDVRYDVQKGDKRLDAQLAYPWLFANQWEEQFEKIIVTSGANVDGEATYLLRLYKRNEGKLADREYHVSKETGLILKEKRVDAELPIPMQTSFSNYKRVGGIMFPFRHVTNSEMTGEVILVFQKQRLVEKLAPSVFTLADPNK